MADRVASPDRLHKAYATQHADGSVAAALIYCRDIRLALLRPSAAIVIDIGCGLATVATC